MTLNISIILYYLNNINNNNHKNDLNIPKLADPLSDVEHAWDSSGHARADSWSRGHLKQKSISCLSDIEYAEALNTNK